MIKNYVLLTLTVFGATILNAQELRSSSTPAEAKVLVTVQSIEDKQAFTFVKANGLKIRLGCGLLPNDLSDRPSRQAAHEIFTHTYLDWENLAEDLETSPQLKAFGYLKAQPRPFTAAEFYCDIFSGKGNADSRYHFYQRLKELHGERVNLGALFTINVHYINGIRIETIGTNKLEVTDPQSNKVLAIYNGRYSVGSYGANLNTSRIVQE